jgi:hypothetical protein
MSSTHWSWFPVRCCCKPRKIFGFLRLQTATKRTHVIYDRAGGHHIIELREAIACMPSISVADYLLASQPVDLLNELATECDLAVYSDDRPIEFWRTIPGFIEAQNDSEKT